MGNNKHNFVVGDWVVPVGTDFGYTLAPYYSEPDFSKPMQVVRIKKNSNLCFGDNMVYVRQGENQCSISDCSLEHAFNNGDEVEVSDDGIQWNKALFVGVNPKITNYRYVVVTERNFSTSSWINIRPVQPKPTTIEWMGQELSIESAKAMVEGINKKLEEL